MKHKRTIHALEWQFIARIVGTRFIASARQFIARFEGL